MSVQAIEDGAIEFLMQPFRDQDRLDAIQQGLARGRAWRQNEKAAAAVRALFEALTPREREARRSQVMRKMNAAFLRHLVRMADKLNLTAENTGAVEPMHEFDLPPGCLSHRRFPPPIPIHLKPILAEYRSAA
jgi:hypothetical protein